MASTVASEWEQVKQLAADFAKTQQDSRLQRLTERNWVEIVKRVVESNLLEVVYTCDGKEYITPQHLLKEMGDELLVKGGRLHLSELVSILNVDFSHVESRANELVRSSFGETSLVLGQLVNRDYKELLAEEVNEKLQQTGVTSIGELTKHYDLPADFLEEVVISRLVSHINGVQDTNDPRTIFTEAYLNQYQAKIRGVLSAITRPTTLSQIVNRYKFPEKIFNNVVEKLAKEGTLSGSLSSGGGRTYVPDIYAKTQNEWVDSFFKQNGYLEYDSLARIGVTDARSYLKKRFSDLIFLETCCVGNSLLFQVDSTLEECIASKSWVDLVPLLPSVLSEKDINQLIKKCIEGNSSLNACLLLCNTIAVSNCFLEACLVPFEGQMTKKAEEDLKNGLLFKSFAAQQSAKDRSLLEDKSSNASRKEDRRKKASGKERSGGGTQGREVKSKAVKKKYNPNQRGAREDLSEEEEESNDPFELVFMSIPDIESCLLKEDKSLKECPPEMMTALAKHLNITLKKKYAEVAKSVFMSSTSSNVASRKKTHTDVQETVNTLYVSIVMFDKGLKVLKEDLQNQLTKYLLRSLCTDILNTLVCYMSAEETPNVTNPEARLKVIHKLDSNLKEPFQKLNSSLNNKSLEDFFAELESVTCECDMMLKPMDKKKEKVMMSENRQNLILQMNQSNEAALVLHLALLILFQSVHKQMLHASGKFVPLLLDFLKPNLEESLHSLLNECQDLVVKQLKTAKGEAEEVEAKRIEDRLHELLPQVKQLSVSPPKKEPLKETEP